MALNINVFPEKIEEEAQHVIGITTWDRAGDLWSYVEFTPGTYTYGTLVADLDSGDLLSTDDGTVTTAAAVDTTRLVDSGEFNGDDFRGAIGSITGGTGAGQNFQVVKVMDANSLEIRNLRRSEKGWQTALDTTSTYRIVIPGRVKTVGTANDRFRGVIQAENFTVPAGEFRYGFVRQTGVGEGLSSGSATIPLSGIITGGTAGGRFIGASSELQIAELQRRVGTAVLAFASAFSGTLANELVAIDFNIVNNTASYRVPLRRIAPTRSVE